MSFIDKATVTVRAGDGGSGLVSFRHEKFVDHGGPDGGDGGNGGDIIFIASRNQNTLANFRYQRELKAPDGQGGGQVRKHGRGGKDLEIRVPVGTVVYNEEGLIVADLAEDDQRAVIAKGGQGGFGNAHFLSSVRQAPRIAEKGEDGQTYAAQLELKMIADVGLVGLPNAGKSTLLSVISNATPEIANYPFTTLKPNLGVASVDGGDGLLFADIPGLIEGAAEGKGLGDEFLRHVERTAVLMHLIDAYQEDIAGTYTTIQNELKAYKIDLSSKPQIVVLTKTEALDDEIIQDQLKSLKDVIPKGTLLLSISAQAHTGLKELLRVTQKLVAEERARVVEEEEVEANQLPRLTIQNEQLAWNVTKTGDFYVVTGHKIEKFAARTDFSNEDGIQRIRDIMKKMGIMHAVVRQGINPGEMIQISRYGKFPY
jgi:GTP-binding protein